jgi:hypothetical protein
MNTTTLKRSKFFKGMAIESTAILPYVNWMSIHGTDLAPAAAYERGCKLRKEEPDQASLKAKIAGPHAYERPQSRDDKLHRAALVWAACR